MSRFSRGLMLVCVVLLGIMGSTQAADLEPAKGPVVLTVIGKIENTNRPPFDEFEDPFVNFHEWSFEKAAEFDLAMLESLGMHEFEVNYEAWPRSIRLAGPRSKDILGQVGAKPTLITMLSLDGFAVELSNDDLDNEDWIVAVKLDKHYMNLGQRGPAWIVFDPGPDQSITEEEEATWPWAAFLIDIE